MGLANKVNSNRNNTVAEGINTKELEYVKAADIAFSDGDPIVLNGFFIQNGKYGKSVTLVTNNGRGINVPDRYVEKFESYTPEEVEEIKAGHLGISEIIPNFETSNGKTTMITFCDL